MQRRIDALKKQDVEESDAIIREGSDANLDELKDAFLRTDMSDRQRFVQGEEVDEAALADLDALSDELRGERERPSVEKDADLDAFLAMFQRESTTPAGELETPPSSRDYEAELKAVTDALEKDATQDAQGSRSTVLYTDALEKDATQDAQESRSSVLNTEQVETDQNLVTTPESLESNVALEEKIKVIVENLMNEGNKAIQSEENIIFHKEGFPDIVLQKNRTREDVLNSLNEQILTRQNLSKEIIAKSQLLIDKGFKLTDNKDKTVTIQNESLGYKQTLNKGMTPQNLLKEFDSMIKLSEMAQAEEIKAKSQLLIDKGFKLTENKDNTVTIRNESLGYKQTLNKGMTPQDLLKEFDSMIKLSEMAQKERPGAKTSPEAAGRPRSPSKLHRLSLPSSFTKRSKSVSTRVNSFFSRMQFLLAPKFSANTLPPHSGRH